MTKSCRKCSKVFCENRNTIEDCPDCVSFVTIALREIDEKLNIQEEIDYD